MPWYRTQLIIFHLSRCYTISIVSTFKCLYVKLTFSPFTSSACPMFSIASNAISAGPLLMRHFPKSLKHFALSANSAAAFKHCLKLFLQVIWKKTIKQLNSWVVCSYAIFKQACPKEACLQNNVKFAKRHFSFRRKPVYVEPLQRPEGIEEWAKCIEIMKVQLVYVIELHATQCHK